MFVEHRVDGSHPKDSIFGHRFLQIIDCLLAGNHRCEEELARLAVFQKRLIGELHRAAGSEHGVGQNERFAIQIGRSHILHYNLKVGMRIVGVSSIG